jgi:hypothetical protein
LLGVELDGVVGDPDYDDVGGGQLWAESVQLGQQPWQREVVVLGKVVHGHRPVRRCLDSLRVAGDESGAARAVLWAVERYRVPDRDQGQTGPGRDGAGGSGRVAGTAGRGTAGEQGECRGQSQT